MHFVDEGAGPAVLMLHGNPTWSYMYRLPIARLADDGHRAIALDHLGCGRSDKPQDTVYSLKTHLDNLEHVIGAILGDAPFDLVVHDWGGPVGLLYAEQHPERIRRIVIMNTVAWSSTHFPKGRYLAKCPFVGAFLVRTLNILIHIALRRMPVHPLSKTVEAAYRAPYRTYRDRIAIQRFPQDIPLGPRHPSHALFKQLENDLPRLASIPMMALWGEKDFCFPLEFLNHWKTVFPAIAAVRFPNASHFLLEDEPQAVTSALCDFLTLQKPES